MLIFAGQKSFLPGTAESMAMSPAFLLLQWVTGNFTSARRAKLITQIANFRLLAEYNEQSNLVLKQVVRA